MLRRGKRGGKGQNGKWTKACGCTWGGFPLFFLFCFGFPPYGIAEKLGSDVPEFVLFCFFFASPSWILEQHTYHGVLRFDIQKPGRFLFFFFQNSFLPRQRWRERQSA